MADIFIGRLPERQILSRILETKGAEFLAIVGRRRVGKTYLVNHVYEKEIVFQITGTQSGNTKKQLRNFRDEWAVRTGGDSQLAPPVDWQEAFQWLKTYLTPLCGEGKKPVVFFDELPWLSGRKSDFLESLGYFWNTWASRQDIVVVICGSAASWMIQNVVNHRGGLHNRMTKRIHLEPFTLAETEEFLKSRDIYLDRYQIALIYMSIGGIPHYLKEIVPGQSAARAINELCFSRNGMLRDEFSRLYPALFANASRHINIVRVLGRHHLGITRQKLIEAAQVSEGGALTKVLDELAYSGFITAFKPFGKKKKDTLYRLTDEYSLFYLQFIETYSEEGGDIWQAISQTPAYRTWCGYAFENLCFKHIPQIKHRLGIRAVATQTSSFFQKGTADSPGAQIDLVIERADRVINLFEVKFYNEPFAPTKEYALQLRRKTAVFKQRNPANRHLSWVMVAAFGLHHNAHSLGLIESVLDLDDLFAR